MSTENTEIHWTATPRARDEAALNAAGLSIRQRKLLTLLNSPLTVTQLAEHVKVPVSEVEVALKRFATNGLVSSDAVVAVSPLLARATTFAPGGFGSGNTVTPATIATMAGSTITPAAAYVPANATIINTDSRAASAGPAAAAAPNRMPLYVGGVALTVVAAAIWFFTRGGSAPPAPAMPAPSTQSTSKTGAVEAAAANGANTTTATTAAATKSGNTAPPAAGTQTNPANNAAAPAASLRPPVTPEPAKPLTPRETAAKEAAAKEAARVAAAQAAAQKNQTSATPPPAPTANANSQSSAAAQTATAPATAATSTTAPPVATPPPSPQPAAPAPATATAAAPAATPAATAARPAPAPAAPREGRLLERVEPAFPRNVDADNGVVRARLAVNAAGAVTGVEIVESNPPRVFDRNVRSALQQWKYEGTGEATTKLVEISFKR
jgi:TonB family protein